jgi:tight adherence protein C
MIGSALAPFIISLSAFVVVFCGVWAGMALYRELSVRRAVLEKVRNETSTDFRLEGADRRHGKREGIMALFGKIGSRYAGEATPKYSVLRLQFLQAGIRNRMAIPAFWGVKIALMAALPLVFFTFRLASIVMSDSVSTLAICCALALAGSYIPDAWLRFRISARKTRISRSLPDALDMLVVCVEAGLALDAAIHRVAEEIRLTYTDLSDELRLYYLELRAGTGREDALNNLARRTDLDEVQSLASLLIQTDRFGTSLAQGLRVYADSFRTKRFMRAEERAATLPTKLLIPLIFFIFPALFVVIVLPAAMRIYYAFIVPEF